MNSTFKKCLSVLLAAILAFSVMTVGFVAVAEDSYDSVEEYVEEAPKGSSFKRFLAKAVNAISNFFLNDVIFNVLCMFLPDADSVEQLSSFDWNAYDADGKFYAGTEDFIDAPEAGAVWTLGYDRESIMPDDFGTPGKYARGSYIPGWFSTEAYTDEDGVAEELRVRTIAISDGTDRGLATFSVVDCIGISNQDIREIRAAATALAKERGIDTSAIAAMNIGATHTHTGIDTQGAWNNPFGALANNLFTKNQQISGVNRDFYAKLISASAESIVSAIENMEPGELTYVCADGSDYLRDRTYPIVCDPNVYCLTFNPANTENDGTIIATFGTHPEITSYCWFDNMKPDTKVSSDLIYYMEKVCNRAGYNFIYMQGNVGTNTTSRGLADDNGLDTCNHDESMRYGYEMGYLCLSFSMTRDERIALNERTGDLLGVEKYAGTHDGYTIWYESPIFDKAPNGEYYEAETVAPYFNIRLEERTLTVENKVSVLLTKTGIASNKVLRDGIFGTYYMITEFGYVEFGDSFRVLLNPGEMYSEILVGGCDEYKEETLRESYGDDLAVCDLMNDAIGYLEPDDYYVLAGIQYMPDSDSFDSETWCLLVSPGKNAASEVVACFHDLLDNVR